MDNKKNHEDKIELQEALQAKSGPEKTITIKESEYEQLKADSRKAQENWDKLVRLQADFENARKRMERDRSEFLRFANEDILCDILTIADELERSVELSQEKHEDHVAFLKGVEMILGHLHDLLKKNGVCCISAKGKCFDPNYHEALMQVEKDELPENTVVEEMQKGYTFNDKVIRTAKVQVSKKKSKDVAKEDKQEK
ncbi:MAG: nucleotide exchange factor GrpE [Candidatus Omnitrophica bacterium]|nr:nucleotide exchange factor GrpE [Candidatus Omnitrophota bacterium]